MVRPYRTSDRESLIEIFVLNTPKYFAFKELKDFEEYLDSYSSTYFTIEHERKIVGGVGYYINPENNNGHITWIFIHPSYKERRLGKEAVEHCLAVFKTNPGIKKSVVNTSQLSFKFFEKLGYTLVKTEKDYWAEDLHLYNMEIEL